MSYKTIEPDDEEIVEEMEEGLEEAIDNGEIEQL